MIDLNMTFVAQVVNFLILVAILRALAYKPVMRMIKKREDKIAESLEKADADQAEAAKLKEERLAQLNRAREEAQAIIDKAEKSAAEAREASLKETEREIEQKKKAADEAIARDQERARAELRREVVQLSLLAAGKVVEKNLGGQENEALVGDFIDKLDQAKIGG